MNDKIIQANRLWTRINIYRERLLRKGLGDFEEIGISLPEKIDSSMDIWNLIDIAKDSRPFLYRKYMRTLRLYDRVSNQILEHYHPEIMSRNLTENRALQGRVVP